MRRFAFSARETAQILGVSHQTVGRMVKAGRLPSIDTGTKRLTIPRYAIEELIGQPITDHDLTPKGRTEVIAEGTFS